MSLLCKVLRVLVSHRSLTSLISDFVSADKTVLMVSEKKTALDVVYSRLGNLSKYALIIDDVGNKELFYKQLQRMVNLERLSSSNMVNINDASTRINDLVKRLEEIANELYVCDEFGVEPYKLYLKTHKIFNVLGDKFGFLASFMAIVINSSIFIFLSAETGITGTPNILESSLVFIFIPLDISSSNIFFSSASE